MMAKLALNVWKKNISPFLPIAKWSNKTPKTPHPPPKKKKTISHTITYSRNDRTLDLLSPNIISCHPPSICPAPILQSPPQLVPYGDKWSATIKSWVIKMSYLAIYLVRKKSCIQVFQSKLMLNWLNWHDYVHAISICSWLHYWTHFVNPQMVCVIQRISHVHWPPLTLIQCLFRPPTKQSFGLDHGNSCSLSQQLLVPAKGHKGVNITVLHARRKRMRD